MKQKAGEQTECVCVYEREKDKKDEFNHWIQAILSTPSKDLANDNSNNSRIVFIIITR